MLAVTHRKGEVAFLKCALRALEKGMTLSRPMIESRYDAILDDAGKLMRVQVKYADSEVYSESVTVYLHRKTTSKTARLRTYTAEEIDLILVYVPRAEKIVALTPAVFDGKHTICLRLLPAKNGQKAGVRYLTDCEW